MFGKKKQEEAKPQPSGQVASEVYEYVDVNITDKMIRCQIDGDEACVKYGKAYQDGDIMRLTASGIVIAEVGKRSKAYTALKNKEGRQSEYVIIKKMDGDYGPYYQIKMKFNAGTVIK